MQGSDPSQYEMIQKMQMLQKRLINKTEEVVEKELLIQEKEKLYMELKHILARQPGPEVAEQLQTYQATLKEKTRQMKVYTSKKGKIKRYRSDSCIAQLTRRTTTARFTISEVAVDWQ